MQNQGFNLSEQQMGFFRTFGYLSWFFRVKCGNETCYRHERFSYELKLISILPDMIQEAPMYALLTQLLDIPNYQVVSAEIGTDKITLDIEGISIALPVQSLDRS